MTHALAFSQAKKVSIKTPTSVNFKKREIVPLQPMQTREDEIICPRKTKICAFQLRAARYIYNVGVRELGKLIGKNRTTIWMWENSPNFEPIKADEAQANIIKNFFEEQGIFFPDDRSISLKMPKKLHTGLLTRFQLRIARIAMKITQDELGRLLSWEKKFLTHCELQKNSTYLAKTPKQISDKPLKDFFEKHGIVFPDDFTVTLEKDPRIMIDNY